MMSVHSKIVTHAVQRWVLFALVLVLAIFPIGWLSTFNPIAAAIVNLLFTTDLARAFAHAFVFFVVGTSALLAFPLLRQMPWRYLALMVVIGVVQEGFQLLYKQQPIGFDEYRDLATDVVGYVVALVVTRWLSTHPVGKK